MVTSKEKTEVNRTHTIYVVFHCCEFYDVPRVLVADATSFQAALFVVNLKSTRLRPHL